MKAIAIKYRRPNRAFYNTWKTETEILIGNKNRTTSKIIEAAQRAIQRKYGMDRAPAITYQVHDNIVAAMVACHKLP